MKGSICNISLFRVPHSNLPRKRRNHQTGKFTSRRLDDGGRQTCRSRQASPLRAARSSSEMRTVYGYICFRPRGHMRPGLADDLAARRPSADGYSPRPPVTERNLPAAIQHCSLVGNSINGDIKSERDRMPAILTVCSTDAVHVPTRRGFDGRDGPAQRFHEASLIYSLSHSAHYCCTITSINPINKALQGTATAHTCPATSSPCHPRHRLHWKRWS